MFQSFGYNAMLEEEVWLSESLICFVYSPALSNEYEGVGADQFFTVGIYHFAVTHSEAELCMGVHG
jgi:hypothetical protein